MGLQAIVATALTFCFQLSANPSILRILVLNRLKSHQRLIIDRHRRTGHDQAGAFAVLDVDAGVVNNQRRAGGASEHDAPVGAGQIADDKRVLSASLKHDARRTDHAVAS